jgi:hypothetical protein
MCVSYIYIYIYGYDVSVYMCDRTECSNHLRSRLTVVILPVSLNCPSNIYGSISVRLFDLSQFLVLLCD